MRKALFLEYKSGDFDSETLTSSGANEVVAAMENLNPARVKQLQDWGVNLTLSFSAFADNSCPLSSENTNRLESLISQAISLRPFGIVFDHLRFDGSWEKIQDGVILNLRPDCDFCRGKSRVQEITKIAARARMLIPNQIKVGYFAVPLKREAFVLGQDHQALGNIFDYISPMLYHRMIHKPVNYISDFTSYLSVLTGKQILPAIQTKDMPDDISDNIDSDELANEYREAIKPPSAGVLWFSYDGAVEKGKTDIISQLNHG